MKIDELIEDLERVKNEHGNLEVMVDEEDEWHIRERNYTNNPKNPILNIADKAYGH